MKSLFDQLPNIVEKSNNLYGLFAVLAIIIGIVALFFFRKTDPKRRERVFGYTVLAFSVFAFITLSAGLFSGVEIGEEQVEDTVGYEEYIVEISPEVNEELENYIRSNNKAITYQERSAVVEEAIRTYIDDSTTEYEQNSSTELATEIEGNTQFNKSEQSLIEPDGKTSDIGGFIITSEGCLRNSEQELTCQFKIVNKEGRKEIKLVRWSGKEKATKITDLNGEQYLTKSIEFAGQSIEGSGQGVIGTELSEGISVKAEIVFESIPQEINQFSFLEVLILPNTSNHSDLAVAQFSEISVNE